MAQCSQRFRDELARINEGRFKLGSPADEETTQRMLAETEDLKVRNRQLETALYEAMSELETIKLDRDELVTILKQKSKDQEDMQRIIDRLTDENATLVAEMRDISQKRRDEIAKSQVEDKYRRALVYIDSLQSKLSRPNRG